MFQNLKANTSDSCLVIICNTSSVWRKSYIMYRVLQLLLGMTMKLSSNQSDWNMFQSWNLSKSLFGIARIPLLEFSIHYSFTRGGGYMMLYWKWHFSMNQCKANQESQKAFYTWFGIFCININWFRWLSIWRSAGARNCPI